MKNKISIFIGIVLVAVGALVLFTRSQKTSEPKATGPQATSSVAEKHNEQTHSRVPAYQKVAETRTLGPTLEPSKFIGKTREAYKIAREIPETLAQLPCYCHCDRGFGHKSLHSCFEDDHASQCAVCTDEALMAYSLQKNQRLSPEQIRKIIIEKYSAEL